MFNHKHPDLTIMTYQYVIELMTCEVLLNCVKKN